MVFVIYNNYCTWDLSVKKEEWFYYFSELINFIDKIILEKSRIII